MNGSKSGNQEFLQLFWDLASLDTHQQQHALVSLLKSLEFCQDRYVKSLSEEQTQDPNQNICPEITYTFQRLVKGLSSSRDDARRGYVIALTEVLQSCQFVELSDIFKAIRNQYKTSQEQSVRGQEERDVWYGTTFAILGIIRSARISKEFEKLTNDMLAQEFVEEIISPIIEVLVEISHQKNFLMELTFQTLISLIQQIPKKVFYKFVNSKLIEIVYGSYDINNWPPEVLALTLFLKIRFGFKITEYFPQWKSDDILSTNNKQLKYIFQSSSYTVPKLHILWGYVCDDIFSSEDYNVATVQFLWGDLIDSFFSSTHGRKYLGFQLFEIFLSKLDRNDIPLLFTPNFLRCFTNNLATEDNYLYHQTKKTLDQLMRTAKADSDLALAVVSSLQGPNGNQSFDAVTKTKTISELLKYLQPKSAERYLETLLSNFYNTTELKTKAVDNLQMWCLEQLGSLTRSMLLEDSEELLLTALRFFFFHSLYNLENEDDSDAFWSRKCKYAISDKVRKHSWLRFLALLRHLNSSKTKISKDGDIIKSKEIDGTMEDGEFWAYKIILFQSELEENDNVERVDTILSDEDAGADVSIELEKALQLVKEIRKKRREIGRATKSPKKSKKKKRQVILSKEEIFRQKQVKAFESLVLHLSLLLNTEPGEISEFIGELKEVFVRLFSNEKLGEDESEPIEVMTDIFVNLLVKPSSTLREIVQSTFGIFSDQINESSFMILLGVISGQSDEMLLEPEESEEEMIPIDEMEEESSSEESLSMSGEGVYKPPIEAEDLTDEQMFAMDENIANILRGIADTKNRQREQKLQLRDFKFRVLDLITIFITRQASNPIIFNAVLPLLDAYDVNPDRTDRPLHQKLCTVFLNKLCKNKRFPRGVVVDTEVLDGILQETFKRALHIKDPTQMKMCLYSILYVVKVYKHAGPENDNILGNLNLELFRELLEESHTMFMKSSNIGIDKDFFLTLVKRSPVLGWNLVEILSNIDNGKNMWRKLLAFEYFIVLSQSSEPIPSELIEESAPFIILALKNVGQEKSLKAKFLKTILRSMKCIVTFCIKNLSQEMTLELFGEIEDILEGIISRPEFNNSYVNKNSVKNILELLKVSQ
eukprot:TRINITY_DN8956_c0_g1_i1.p1 TRINITY_DN8956_c0_g1~~TRINITY_DN8956_c0_g1_i1.p1  ORF type:complete len:1106 (-),score=257.60 TRINITY_DN8956_c0_g1_i1:111-3428(-)